MPGRRRLWAYSARPVTLARASRRGMERPICAVMNLFSIRPRQAEDVLGQEAQDQVGRDRRHLVEPRFAELALDVVLLGKAEAAMGLHARFAGGPGCVGGQELRHV